MERPFVVSFGDTLADDPQPLRRTSPRVADIEFMVLLAAAVEQVAARVDEGTIRRPTSSSGLRIVHVVDGPVEIEAVRRAIELSATKYCTVTGILASGVTEIHHAYLVYGEVGEERYGEVVVTGPNEVLMPLVSG